MAQSPMTQNEKFLALSHDVIVACRNRANHDGIRSAVTVLAKAVEAAVKQAYPDLCGWQVTVRQYMEDKSKRRSYCDAARVWAQRVVPVAASRISEAYGLGTGSDWLGIAFDSVATLAGQTADSVAAAQVLQSLR